MGDPSNYKAPDTVFDPETGEDIPVEPTTATVAAPSDPSAPVLMTQAQFAEAMGAAIAKGVADGMAANAPIRKVTFGEYIRTGYNPFHPEGKAKMPKPARKFYQNGVELPLELTHDREIRLLNRITHSGRYIDRMVEVIFNTDSADESVNIRWNNAELNDRFEMKGRARDFTDMLQQIVDAQEAEDRDSARRDSGKAAGRTWGQNKQSQAAREAAEANSR